MIFMFFVLILIYYVLVMAVIKSKGRLRKVFSSILLIIILIPVTFILLIKPAQQGKVCPKWGKISLLFCEPEDLWHPLAETSLRPEQAEYNFHFSHKYVGNHNVQIRFSNKDINVMKADKNDLCLTIFFYDKNKIVFTKTTTYVGSYKSPSGSGFRYIKYSLPENLPVAKELNVKIEISGNIEKFINKYGKTEIVIRKGSDL